jgi:butyrate kinase
MGAVLKGRVDALLLTGGMAYSERVISFLRDTLAWIAPIQVYPGEDELQALAEGVFRVLDGEEQAKLLLPEITEGAEARANRTRLVIGLE